VFFQVAKEGPESVSIKEILLELRTYRMGLIQVKTASHLQSKRNLGIPGSIAFNCLLRIPETKSLVRIQMYSKHPKAEPCSAFEFDLMPVPTIR
jgi:hypothetical protein